MQPLPEILRPNTIEDFVGQHHLLGKDGPLTRLLSNNFLPSMILWGPPGVGKTTLAYILARRFNYGFLELSGVEFSVKTLEQIKPKKQSSAPGLFDEPKERGEEKTVVFVDEIHRLNKSQQAQFLPYVERGEWMLIGATTENPSFEVISPLLSRSQVLILKELQPEDLSEILERGLKLLEKQNRGVTLTKDVKEYLLGIANGDARLLLNALEMVARMYGGSKPRVDEVQVALGNLHLVYDKKGEEHYNTISALHKSMRGSNPDAALYYLGRMLEAGEDPLYVARRCLRFAAEDIGLADPQALILAETAFRSVEKIGMPESNVILAELVIYLSKAPKSNSAYMAYSRVQYDIQKYGNLPIPLKLRNAPTKFMKGIGYGKDYKYAPDYTDEELKDVEYLPDKLKGRKYIK